MCHLIWKNHGSKNYKEYLLEKNSAKDDVIHFVFNSYKNITTSMWVSVSKYRNDIKLYVWNVTLRHKYESLGQISYDVTFPGIVQW